MRSLREGSEGICLNMLTLLRCSFEHHFSEHELEYFMKVYFGSSLPSLDFAGVSFTKWKPVESIDFLSGLVEPERVLEGFNFKQLRYQDISIWVWRYKSTLSSRVCLNVRFQYSHAHFSLVYSCTHTVERVGLLFAPFHSK